MNILLNNNIYSRTKVKTRYCTIWSSVISEALANHLKPFIKEILNRCVSLVADTALLIEKL